MAIATFGSPSSTAGPSVPKKRVAEFQEASSGEEDDYTEDNVRTPGVVVNGTATANGHDSPSKRVHASATHRSKKRQLGEQADGEGERKAREARRAEADKLLVVRQELPFYQGREMILQEMMAHDTTIIIGETGCGKSTQLPQLLRTHPISLDHFSPPSTSTSASHSTSTAASRWARGPSIAITQPRRLPTISLASRVSAEMGCVLGGEVGYSVRFEDVTGRGTKVRYLTEGVLMRELANGSGKLNLLLKYDVIVVDEAHERTLNTDFLCGALKRIQRIRKRLVAEQAETESLNSSESSFSERGKGKENEADAEPGQRIRELKIVIMSATLDPAKFSNFFETGRDALLVKGRMYEVGTRYLVNPVDDFIESAARNVLQIHLRPNADGDVLVFMPGSEEIENCCELLRRASKELPEGSPQLEVLPLYASLPPTAQIRIFAAKPPNMRRVVVATNIAETSITIPGIAYVIDTGYKKEKEYIFRTAGALEHLAKKPISKAAAWQRTGRAGRERSGECYRLYTNSAFEKLQEFDAPEIQRCNLASAVLQLVAMGLDPFDFEYIDNPGRDPIAAAFQTLAGLGALDSPTSITPLGRDMLKYPLDPSHARILIASFELACPNEIIDILAMLNSGNVWIDRASDRDSAINARAKFVNRDGDHLTALNVFRAWLALKEQRPSNREFVKWCKENHVNGKTLNQALKIRDQLRDLAEKNGKDWKSSAGGESSLVIRCLIKGLFMNTAVVLADGSYRQTAGNLQVKIHPSSVLMSKKVPAILYDELAITSSIYARNVSSFDQSWLADVPWFAKAGLSVAHSTPADSI